MKTALFCGRETKTTAKTRWLDLERHTVRKYAKLISKRAFISVQLEFYHIRENIASELHEYYYKISLLDNDTIIPIVNCSLEIMVTLYSPLISDFFDLRIIFDYQIVPDAIILHSFFKNN